MDEMLLYLQATVTRMVKLLRVITQQEHELTGKRPRGVEVTQHGTTFLLLHSYLIFTFTTQFILNNRLWND